MTKHDEINHPKHYTSHPNGIECIEVTEQLCLNIGCAIGYLWRCNLKHETPISDLKKALWHINREIERRKKYKREYPKRYFIGDIKRIEHPLKDVIDGLDPTVASIVEKLLKASTRGYDRWLLDAKEQLTKEIYE